MLIQLLPSLTGQNKQYCLNRLYLGLLGVIRAVALIMSKKSEDLNLVVQPITLSRERRKNFEIDTPPNNSGTNFFEKFIYGTNSSKG